ncbi:MAG TPA: ABC transporter substrate-binding protein [Candidatus Tectomicrobia bacterium]|nr:ABC transporter substrate-binding protein [Candidatus Tectomicrobia bacterium]
MCPTWKLLAGYPLLAVVTLMVAIDCTTARTAQGVGPQERVQATLNAVSAVLETATVQGTDKDQDRKQRLRQIIFEAFDFREMARESLGTHWGTLTLQQRDEFTDLFGNFFERSYNRLVLRLLGERSTVYGTASTRQDRAIVPTTLVSKRDAKLPVDYQLVRHGERWTIYDVVIDGISLTSNYRAQFSKILRSSSFEALVQRIKSKLQEESL